LAVIGLLFKVSEESHPFIKQIDLNDKKNAENDINFTDLFTKYDENGKPIDPGFFHYQGSLTFPPCFETVNWMIYKEVLPISKEHLRHFSSYCFDELGFLNYREVQPLLDRKLVRNFFKNE
jgi:carbonic anhydrase